MIAFKHLTTQDYKNPKQDYNEPNITSGLKSQLEIHKRKQFHCLNVFLSSNLSEMIHNLFKQHDRRQNCLGQVHSIILLWVQAMSMLLLLRIEQHS